LWQELKDDQGREAIETIWTNDELSNKEKIEMLEMMLIKSLIL
jgi:hypothetical protein